MLVVDGCNLWAADDLDPIIGSEDAPRKLIVAGDDTIGLAPNELDA